MGRQRLRCYSAWNLANLCFAEREPWKKQLKDCSWKKQLLKKQLQALYMHSLKMESNISVLKFFSVLFFQTQVVYERTWSVTPWRRIWSSNDARKYWYAKRAWKVLRRLNLEFWNKSRSLKYSFHCSPKKLLRKVSSRSKLQFKRN